MNLDHVSFTFMFLAAVHTGDDVDDVTSADDVVQLEAEQHRLERKHICGASTPCILPYTPSQLCCS